MNSLVYKIAGLLPVLEARGTVYLFALAEREDITGWDIVFCSQWSDPDWIAATGFIIDELRPLLEPREFTSIARVAVVVSSNPRVQEMSAAWYGTVPGDQRITYSSLLGSDVRQAFIFKANRPPMVPVDAVLAAAAIP